MGLPFRKTVLQSYFTVEMNSKKRLEPHEKHLGETPVDSRSYL
jgi:hypothetical protein